MRKLKKNISLIILILFFIQGSLFSNTRYYQSNDIGMKLKEINEADISTYEYILIIDKRSDQEKRNLYLENELIKRWELSLYNNKNVREERVFNKEVLESLRYFDRRGRLIEEHLYSDNLFTQKTMYIYGENQELFQTKTFNNTGALIYYEKYDFNRLGMIRKVKRIWSDGRIQVSSFIYGKGRLVEEVFSTKNEMTISRYDDSGKLLIIEVWKKEDNIRNTHFFYKKDGSLESSLENNLAGGFETEKKYNTEERLSKEIITKSNKTISETTYFYDDEGRKIKMNKVSDKGLEEWAFYYDSEGDLDREEYYQRGILEKRTVYTNDNSYYEELFRYGELLIRVFYEDDVKIKEEFLENGKVIKVKTAENEE